MPIKFFQAQVYFDVGSSCMEDSLLTEAFFISREKAQAWADQQVKDCNNEMGPLEPPTPFCLDDQSPTYHYSVVMEVETKD